MARPKYRLQISYTELAKRMGITPQKLRNQIVRGEFPIGYAARNKKGGMSIHIPREPAEYYLRTGKFPI